MRFWRRKIDKGELEPGTVMVVEVVDGTRLVWNQCRRVLVAGGLLVGMSMSIIRTA